MGAGEGESWETVRWTKSLHFTYLLDTWGKPIGSASYPGRQFLFVLFLNCWFYQPSKYISIPLCCNIVSPLSASSILLFKSYLLVLLISSSILFQDFTILFRRTLKLVSLMLHFSSNNNPHFSTLLSSSLSVWMDVQWIYDSWCKLVFTGSFWCQ